MPTRHSPYSVLRALILAFVVLAAAACGPRSATVVAPPQTSAPSAGVMEANVMGGGLTPPPPSDVHGAPVRVALLVPMSGPNATLGQAMFQAAQLAIFDIGIDNLELVPRDTGTTPADAQQAATAALDDGAQLILGPLLADSVRAVKGVAKARGVNVITFSTDGTLAGDNTFVMGFMPDAQVDRVVSFAATKGYRTAAIVAPRDKYGDAVVAAFENQARRSGITINGRLRFSADKATMQQEVKDFAAKLAPTQAVFVPVGGAQLDAVTAALSFNGMTPDKIKYLGTGLWDDAAVAGMAGVQGGWFAGPSPRSYQTFETKYRSTYGSAPPRLASLAYDATALAAVLTRTGGQRGGATFDRASLTNPNGFAGMDGIFRFNNGGLIERGLSVLEIRQRRVVEAEASPRTFQSSQY